MSASARSTATSATSSRRGVPIEGEAGVGYIMTRGFDLPPLMFTAEEIDVIVLGARMVESYGGEVFARRAHDVLSKVQAALPDRLRPRLERVDLYAPGFHVGDELTANLEPLRVAIVDRKKVRLDYESRSGEATKRRVRPLGLYFWGRAWTLVGWCELRSDFRSFRPDRILGLETLDETFVRRARSRPRLVPGADDGTRRRRLSEDQEAAASAAPTPWCDSTPVLAAGTSGFRATTQ